MPNLDYRPASVLGDNAPHGQLTSTPIPNSIDMKAWEGHPLAKWIPYFGVPPGVTPQTAGLSVVRDLYTMPEAYKGQRNARLETILIHQIATSRKYPITDLLPLIEWDGALEIVWDEWKFHDHRLSRTPELSVSRLLTSNFSEDRTYMVRWGIMFQLEHGFFMTERGRKQFAMNMQQMSNACIETLNHGVFIRLLSSQPMAYDPAQLRSSVSSEDDRDNLFRAEINMANIMVKRPNALVFVWDKLREQISDRSMGLEANRLVLPYGMAKYANATRPENMWTFLQGKTLSLDRAASIQAGTGPGTIIYESQKWRTGENTGVSDPVYQDRTWGHYHWFDDRKIQNISPLKYETHMMDVKIFSDKKDDWVRSPYAENVAKSALFIRNNQLNDGGRPYPTRYPGGSGAKADGLRGGKPSWELSALGQRFFSGYATCGDFVKGVGVLHKWKAVLEKDEHRRYEFLRQFLTHSGMKSKVAALQESISGAGNLQTTTGPGSNFATRAIAVLQASPEDLRERKQRFEGSGPSGVRSSSSVRVPRAPVAAQAQQPRVAFAAAEKAFFENKVNHEASQQMFAYIYTFLQKCDERGIQLSDDAWEQIRQASVEIVGNRALAVTNRITNIFNAQIGQPAEESKQEPSRLWMYTNEEQGEGKFESMEFTGSADIGQVLQLVKSDNTAGRLGVVASLIKRLGAGTALPAGEVTQTSLRTVRATLSGSMHPLQWTIARALQDALREYKDDQKLGDIDDDLDNVVVKSVYPVLTAEAEKLKREHASGLGGVDVDGRGTLVFKSRLAELNAVDDTKDENKDMKIDDLTESEEESLRQVKQDRGIDATLKQIGVLYRMSKDSLQLLYQRLVLSNLAPDGKSKSTDDKWSARQFIVVLSIIEKLYMEWLHKAQSSQRRRDQEQAAQGKLEALLNELLAGELLDLRRQIAVEYKDRFATVFAPNLSLAAAIDLSKSTGIQLWQSLDKTAASLYTLQSAYQEAVFDEITKKIGAFFAKGAQKFTSIDQIARLTRSPIEDLAELGKKVSQGDGTDPSNIPLSDAELARRLGDQGIPYVLPVLMALPIELMGDVVKFGLEYNMWPLLGIRAHRLYATWLMGSAIALIGGGVTGNTLKKQVDFMLGDNPSQKKHMGHLTMYAASTIWNKATVAIANNIYPRGYIGGYNDKIWDYTNKFHRQDYLQHGLVRANDILPFPVPINEPEPPNYYDVTGKFAVPLRTPTDPEPYTFAKDMCDAWRIRHAPGNPFKRDFINYNGQAASTTIVFCDHHQRYTQDNNGNLVWEDVYGCGPRGAYNYPGIASVFRGEDMWIRPINRGGTAVTSIGV